MNLFKNFIGGLKIQKTNNGIEEKKQVKLTIKRGAVINGDISIGSLADELINQKDEELIKKKNDNLDIISNSDVPDGALENIQNIEHIKQIDNFINKGEMEQMK